MPIETTISDLTIRRMRFAKRGHGADYRWDRRVPGFGVRVYPSGKKAFVITYRGQDGRWRYHTLCDTALLKTTEAREYARQELAKAALGEDPQADRQARRNEITVHELIDHHVEALKPRKRSWHTDELFLRKYVRPAVGRYRISDVTLKDLEKIKAQVGQRQSASSTNLLCTAMRRLFDSAVRWELLESSPAQKLSGVRPPPPNDIILSAKEVRRIEGALDREPHGLMAAMIRFLLYTGRRSGEVMRLQWSDVDLAKSTVRITVGKTQRLQTAYLNSAALRVLESVDKREGCPFVFSTGRHHSTYCTMIRVWARVLRRAEIEHIPLHGLRHNFASTLIASGVNIEVVRLLLGHERISSTMRYIHHRPLQLYKAAQLFEKALDEPVAPPAPLAWSPPDHAPLFPTGSEPDSRDSCKGGLHTDPMKMGRRIRQARLAKGLSQQKIADRFGISRAAVAQWESGDTNPGTAKLEGVADILGVRIEWLTTGRGEMAADAESEIFSVPLIDLATAAHWPKAAETLEPGGQEIPSDCKLGPNAFAMQIEDEAMVPEFAPGDRVIVDPAVEPRPGDFVVGWIHGLAKAVLRRYRETGTQAEGAPSVQLVTSNPDWPVLDLKTEFDDKLIGTVVEQRRYRKP